jgi:nucleotide-binding universal stress UspA family protein
MKVRECVPERVVAVANAPRPVARVPRPSAGTRRVLAQGRAAPRVVLALMDLERPTGSLRRAVAYARTLGMRLHVVCVLPGAPAWSALFSRQSVLKEARAGDRTPCVERETRAWLRDSLGDEEVIEHVAVAHGGFVEQAAAYSASIASQLIIVPPRKARLSEMVTSLAAEAKTPVLIAHERPGKPAIVAATDLESNGYPVLREAAELGQRFHAHVVALHNVEPVPSSVVGTAWAGNLSQPPVVRATRSQELARAVGRFCVAAETVVLDDFSSARAILAEAAAREAGVVVVGTRRHAGWLGKLGRRRVAAQVIERASCSVLVLPLDGRRPG